MTDIQNLYSIKVANFNPSTSRYQNKPRMQRSLLIFENSIKSKFTKKEYMHRLKTFLEFTGIKDYDTLANLDSDSIQSFLEDYILDMRSRGLKSVTIKNYLSGPKLFFDMNRKFYHRKILAKMIPEMEKEGNEKPYTTDDIKAMLGITEIKRTRALVHFFASTGARPNVLGDPVLKLRHLHEMPMRCKAVFLYEGSREEYWAFLTPEAASSLEEYLQERRDSGENLTPESTLFATRPSRFSQSSYLSATAARELMSNLVEKAGITRFKTGERFDKA